MARSLVGLGAALLPLLLADAAPAQEGDRGTFTLWGREFSFGATSTLEYTYHFENGPTDELRHQHDDERHEWFNTLDLSLTTGDFRFGTRLDLYAYADRPHSRLCGPAVAEPASWCLRDGPRYPNSYYVYRNEMRLPERIFLVVARPELDLTLGDFYASLGKGIALNVVKIAELGQDTTIRGGKFEYHHNDVGVTFLAGEFNPLDIDKATGYVAPWRAEPVIAGRIESRFFDMLLLGVHGVYVMSEDGRTTGRDVARTDYNAIWGIGIDIPSMWDGRLSFSSEFDLQRTVSLGETIRGPGAADTPEDDNLKGVASYSTATLQLGGLTTLMEFKYYNDFDLAAPSAPEGEEPYQLSYHQPPTLERIIAEIDDDRSVTGGRLRLDYSFGDLGSYELVVFANYGLFEARELKGDVVIQDPFIGFEFYWSDGAGHFNAQSGARYQRDSARSRLDRLDVHLELDVEQALAAQHAIKLTVLYQNRRKHQIRVNVWNELDSALEYKWSPYLSAAFTVDFQSDATVGFRNEIYFGGSLRYFLNAGTYLGLRIGQNRGGFKCLNGQCRVQPPFAGARLIAVGRY